MDAIGSICCELAAAAEILNLARALRVFQSGALDDHRPRLVLHGAVIMFLAMGTTLVADGIREVPQPGWDVSVWGKVLIMGLAGLALLGVLTALALIQAAQSVWALPTVPQPSTSGWLGEAMEDAFLLVWLPAGWLERRLPSFGQLRRFAEGVWRGPLALRLKVQLAWASPLDASLAVCTARWPGSRPGSCCRPHDRGFAARPGSCRSGVVGVGTIEFLRL